MALKSPNWGIGMRGPNAPNSTMNDIRHFYIIEVHWGDAQPGTSGGTVPPSPLTAISSTTATDIKNKVNAVRTYNTANTRVEASVGYTSGSKALTFTGTALTSADVGQYVYKYQDIPLGTTIASVNAGAHTAQLDTNAAATGSSITVGQPQGLRLRVECGQYTPAWAFAGLTGATIQDNKTPTPDTTVVPRWWDLSTTQTVIGVPNLGPVQAYYANFMSGLANLNVPGSTINGVVFPDYTVDNCPEIREVTVGLTMCFFGEVFFRFAGTNGNNAQYTSHGYTSHLDHLAMKRQMDIHGAAFKSTVTMLDCNTFNAVTDSDGLTKLGFTEDVIDYSIGVGSYSTVVCPGLQLTNASMINDGSNGPLFSAMQNYGPVGTGDAARNNICSVSFQTYPETQVTSSNVGGTLARAISYGATSVESINQSGSDTWTVIHGAETASNYDQQLMQNLATSLSATFPWRPSLALTATAAGGGSVGSATLTSKDQLATAPAAGVSTAQAIISGLPFTLQLTATAAASGAIPSANNLNAFYPLALAAVAAGGPDVGNLSYFAIAQTPWMPPSTAAPLGDTVTSPGRGAVASSGIGPTSSPQPQPVSTPVGI